MKKSKLFLPCMALLLTFNLATAKDKSLAKRLTKTYAIETYTRAISLGRIDDIENVLDPTFKFSQLHGDSVVSSDKKEMLDFFERIRDVDQHCAINIQNIESSNNVFIVKLDMKYHNLVRSNYITVANTGQGWKITSVYSSFKSK